VSASERLGRALFRIRSVTPLPLIAVGAVAGHPTSHTLVAGAAITLLGELIRAASVSYVGPGSRTRGDRVGALVTSGPYARCRNPIYLGNLLIGAGACWAVNVPLLVAAFAVLFFAQYGFVVAWEEAQLREAHGKSYRAYCEQVPRWFPRPRFKPDRGRPRYPARKVLRSERSTLVAIVLVYIGLGVLAVLRA